MLNHEFERRKIGPMSKTLGFNRTQKWWIWSINGWMERQQRHIHIFSTFLLGSRGLRLVSTWCLEFGWSNDPGAKPGAKFGARLENGSDLFDEDIGSCDNIEMVFSLFWQIQIFFHPDFILQDFCCTHVEVALQGPAKRPASQKNFLASAWRWCRSYGHHGIPSMVWLMGNCWLILIGNPWKFMETTLFLIPQKRVSYDCSHIIHF